jgi:hypothetical protein
MGGANREILQGYCTKVQNPQRWHAALLQDELFALFKFAWLENARLLAQRKGANYYFLLSFLTEPEAARFVENFARHKTTAFLLEPFEVRDTRGFVPWGGIVPWDVAADLTARLATDEDLQHHVMDSLIERDRETPQPDYLFALPEETKEEWLEHKRREAKKKI